MGTGFYPSEANGMCWSSQEKTEIRVTGLAKEAYLFTLMHGYSIPLAELGKESISMGIDVNGTHIADITVDGSNNGQDLEFEVTADLITGGTEVVTITADPWSPAEYGSPDARRLGFSTSGLKALKLN
jgi:hypothetical protein